MSEQHLSIIGEKLRTARQASGLTLRELGEKADVSPSLISQIENGKSNPSVMTLHHIAGALNMPVTDLFPNDATSAPPVPTVDNGPQATVTMAMSPSEARTETNPLAVSVAGSVLGDLLPRGQKVLRATDRPAIELMGDVVWERLTAEAINGAEFLQIHYPPGTSSGPALSNHSGREFGIVLAGVLTLELGFDTHVLHPGDSVIFDSITPHRLSNTGDSVLQAIWVLLTHTPGRT